MLCVCIYIYMTYMYIYDMCIVYIYIYLYTHTHTYKDTQYVPHFACSGLSCGYYISSLGFYGWTNVS